MNSNPPIDRAFKEILQDFTEEQIKDFFERHFLCKLTNQLDTDDQIPAEAIRQRRKQTNVIRNYLLTFSRK